jgi:hypothetical protein
LDDIDSFTRINQKSLSKGMGAELIKKVSSAKSLMANFDGGNSQSFQQAIEENIKLLKDFETSIENSALRLFNLDQSYNWSIDLALFKEFIITSEENQIKKEGFNSILETSKRIIDNPIQTGEGRVLKNQRIIKELPSTMMEETGWMASGTLNLEALMKLENVLINGINTIQVNNYIVKYMSNNQNNSNESRFFKNEVEYILYGNKSDAKNYDSFKVNYLAVRVGLNLIHIFSSTEKRNQIVAIANGITPGPWSLCTELVIATAWATVEAENDLKLVEAGKRVALIKNEGNWAIDVYSLLKGTINQAIIPTDSEKGLNYADYLQLFLLFEPREIKLLRCLDIIQINMKGNYSKDFSIKDYYCGFGYHAFISKKSILPEISLFQLASMEISGTQLY